MADFNPDIHHKILLDRIDKKTYDKFRAVCNAKKPKVKVLGSLTELVNRYMEEIVRINK